jgi:hypothetical protein
MLFAGGNALHGPTATPQDAALDAEIVRPTMLQITLQTVVADLDICADAGNSGGHAGCLPVGDNSGRG